MSAKIKPITDRSRDVITIHPPESDRVHTNPSPWGVYLIFDVSDLMPELVLVDTLNLCPASYQDHRSWVSIFP